MSKIPPRLLDDPNAPAGLRLDLERARGAVDNYDVTAGLALLQASVSGSTGLDVDGPPSLSPADRLGTPNIAATASSTLVKSLLVKLGIGGSALGGVALAVATATYSPVPNTPTPSPSRPKRVVEEIYLGPAPSTDRPTSSSTPPSVTLKAGTPTGHQPGDTAHQVTLPANRGARPKPGTSEDVKLRAEVANLAQIKALLRSDPNEAYRRAEQAHSRFGRSLLYPEREALAILALIASGQAPQTRARAFIRAYPDSPLKARIVNALAQQLDQANDDKEKQ